MSIDCGESIAMISRDHKPDDEQEKIRIQLAGGKIYRTQTFARPAQQPGDKDIYVQGPLRVFPGRLSVARTFGDLEAKKTRFGGNPNVVISEPEIRSFKIEPNFDFIMMGCDGIFDRLTNRDVVDTIWESTMDMMKAGDSRKHMHHGSQVLQSQQHSRGGFLNSLEQANNTHRKFGGA